MNRRQPSLRWAIVYAALVPAGLVSGQPPTTPQGVWAGFDPREEPLEVEVLRRWTEHDADYTEFTFTGMNRDGSKVRVYAISSAPIDRTGLPGILHVHGGGQTVNSRWLRFWNERGYAALTFNWGGVWPDREKVTDWGELTQGNHKHAGAKLMATAPSVRDSSWYLWTRVSLRALTCLERMDAVDPQRLGVFGVSMGGTIVWPMAATDERIKAACAIYGVGWNTYPDAMGVPDPKAEDAGTVVWRRAMEPEAYAPLVRCPVLFLDATNDQHGKMDWAYRTFARVPTEIRWAFTPRYRHHIAAEQGQNLPLWMDAHLKGGEPFPKTPVAEVRLDDEGIARLTVRPDPARPIRRANLFYAVENRNPKNRYWRSAEADRDGATWTASLPVPDTTQPLFAFGNVLYEDGVCLSTNLVAVTPADLGAARATDAPAPSIGADSDGIDGWVTRSPATDPIPPVPTLLRAAEGPDGVAGLTVTRAIPILTHQVGDPRWRGPEGSSLRFRVFVRAARTVRVVMHREEFAPGWTQYARKLRLEPGDGWQTITLSAKDFTTDDGEPLPDWREVQMLELDSAGGTGDEPIFRGFRWVRPD